MRRLMALPVLALALTAAGCGTGGIAHKHGNDLTAGKKLFIQECGSCHTLADAGTQGKIGPDLDEAFKYDREQGFAESSIQNVVLDQIRIAELPMPANLVTGQDAQNVAAYVASVAGLPAK
jgi:mono/diheme cytochrome c family protein